ncbi:MAG: hypothetical protein KGL39_25275 [Patescibacteria group bacterium]|nr:hypothetical protein [Patescibacteria group bacterium]
MTHYNSLTALAVGILVFLAFVGASSLVRHFPDLDTIERNWPRVLIGLVVFTVFALVAFG